MIQVDDTRVKNCADASRALALEIHDRFSSGPVDEIGATGATGVAKVAEGDLCVDRLLRRVVKPLEVLVNQNLGDRQHRQHAEEPD